MSRSEPDCATSAGGRQRAPVKPELPPGAPRAHLAVAGPAPAAACSSLRPVTLLGSRRDCDLPLNHPSVSKVHCALVNSGRALLARDLCSRSGTFVNGRPVRLAALNPGDELRLGAVGIEVAFSRPPPADPRGPDPTRLAPPLLIQLRGRRVEESAAALVIGRRATCDIVLDTPDVSPAHTLIFALNGRPAAFDLGSRSGTLLNGRPVMLAWLHDGDRLTIGGEQVTVARAAPATSAVEPLNFDQTRPAARLAPRPPGGLRHPARLEPSLAASWPCAPGPRLRSTAGRLTRTKATLEAECRRLAAWAAELERQQRELQAPPGPIGQLPGEPQTGTGQGRAMRPEADRARPGRPAALITSRHPPGGLPPPPARRAGSGTCGRRGG